LKPLLLINSYPPTVGGAERLVQSLAGEFAAIGHPCIILTRKTAGAPYVERMHHISIYRCPVLGTRMLRSMIFRMGAFILLVALRSRYDCIHAHSLDSPAVIASLAGRLLGKDVFVTIHNTGKVRSLLARFRGNHTLGKIISASKALISINREITEELTAAGCPPGKIAFIPNGVDTARFTTTDDKEKQHGLFNMGLVDRVIYIFVGNFHDQKGIDTLIRAWRIFQKRVGGDRALLLLAGDGVLLGDMKKLVLELGLSSTVRFLGKRNEIDTYLKLADVFVLPSRWEGLSIALLEALSSGKAVVATPVGGTRDIIRDGTNGLLTSVDDIPALADKLHVLYADETLRKRIGLAGRQTVLKRYSLKICAENHMRLYSSEVDSGTEHDETDETEIRRPTALERDKPTPGEKATTVLGKLS
jgi:glycosyltransferase involved in cell wall biosynthesis